MLTTLSAPRNGFKPRASWVAAATLSLGVLFGPSAAFAVAPPANTVIGNQASASYFDAGGNTQLATSNLVQTTVQQVGSFNLDGNTTVTTNVANTKVGAAGVTVYAPHTLTNTGNGPDGFNITVTAPAGFSRVEVFADANGDGLPDSTTPLCTAVPAATCTVPTQTVAGSNGKFPFVVAYTIPGTATTPTTPFSTGTVTGAVVPASPAFATYTSTSAADVDNVNLTNVAAFNATKTLGVPAVAFSSGAWPAATTSGPRSGASCPVTIAAAQTPPAGCSYTVYTLNFSNTGGAAGRFALRDALPSGMTYVPGSAVWSSAPGVALTDAAGGDTAGIDFQSTGNVVTAVVSSLGVNVSQTVSFIVQVNSTATVGTTTSTNTATYNPLDAPGATSTTPGATNSSTNPSVYTVLASYGIVLGANPSTAVSALDTTPGTPNATTADQTTRPSVVAGSSVKFSQTVFNTGNAADTINLAIASNNFPAGTTFTFFAADGVTPLLDTTGDSIVDTGPVALNSSTNIVVQANVPASALVGSGPFNAVVRGTSFNDPTKFEATRDIVTIVIGSLVDLTNSTNGTGSGSVAGGDLGPGPSPQPTTTNTVAAGTGTVFSLFVKNNDSIAQTYNLAASQTTSFPGTLPAGWTVKFVAGPAGTCASAPVTTVAVLAGAQTQVNACVTPPASQVAVTAQNIYFQVQSTAVGSTGVIVSDAKTDAVTVTVPLVYSTTLTPNNSGQIAPGGTVVYAHTLTNTGNQSCGAYTLTATVPAGDATAGWTTAIYLDVNGDGQIDAGDTLVTGAASTPGPIAAGGTQKLLVKVFAPGGATPGVTDTATVTATFAANCGSPSATDISTVITGQIRVVKTQALDAACDGTADTALSAAPIAAAKPGQCLVYQVVTTNQGTSPITNITINDAVPAYTSLAGATQPANQCVSSGVTGTAVAYAATASTVSCGSAANSVAPSGTATLTFAVKINQ